MRYWATLSGCIFSLLPRFSLQKGEHAFPAAKAVWGGGTACCLQIITALSNANICVRELVILPLCSAGTVCVKSSKAEQ